MAARRDRAGPVRRRAGRPPGRGGGYRLRWAAAPDLPTLVDHRRRMWREIRRFSRAALDRHDRAYRRWVRALMSRGKFVAVVAEDTAGRPVGSGAIWRMPAQPRPGPLGRGEIPYILSMYTVPSWRGRGVATGIVHEMVRWARGEGFARIVLHASRFGRPVYERLGFEDGSEMRLALSRAGRSRTGPPARRETARSR